MTWFASPVRCDGPDQGRRGGRRCLKDLFRAALRGLRVVRVARDCPRRSSATRLDTESCQET